MDEHRRRRHRRQGAEHAYVADALDKARRIQRTTQEADVEGGHDQSGDGGGKAFQGGTHTEQRALQAIPYHEGSEAEQQDSGSSGGRQQRAQHR